MKKKDSLSTNREILPDIIRGFAIILVVFGHCIQEGNGAEYVNNSMFWSNEIYQLIYSFHMPLFMLLAGYFGVVSIRKCSNISDGLILLRKRVILYILPVFVWTVFEYARGYILSRIGGYPWLELRQVPVEFFKYFITNLWFLWAVLVCFLLVWFMHFILKDNIYIYGLIILSFFILPDGYNLGVYKYLIPFYLVAYYYHYFLLDEDSNWNGRLKSILEKVSANRVYLCIVLLVVFIGLFFLYNENSFIYLTGYRINKGMWYVQLYRDIYRFVIGMVGSLLVINIFKIITDSVSYDFPVLRSLGRNSLGIYIISGYLILLVMRRFTDSMDANMLRVILETIIICVLSWIITVIMSVIPGVRRLVGKNKK